ncbi:MAG: hypothetical protein ACOC33_03300 [bacterium]
MNKVSMNKISILYQSIRSVAITKFNINITIKVYDEMEGVILTSTPKNNVTILSMQRIDTE